MSKNKLTIIIVSVVAVLALGLGIFFAWKKSNRIITSELLPGLAPSVATSTTATQIKSAAGALTVLGKNKVFYYWIYTPSATSSAIAKNIMYISPDGAIFAITNGKEQKINGIQASNMQSVKASSDGKWIFIKSGSFNQSRFDFLNVEKNIWQPATTDVVAADWSLDGEKLVYLQNNIASKSFDLMIKDMDIAAPIAATSTKSAVAKSKTQQPQKIISLNQTDFDLRWYEADKVLLIPKPSINYISDIWEVDIKTKLISKMMSGNGIMINWLKFGNQGLKFTADSRRNYNFSMVDDKGNTRGTFKFKTFPDKCLINSFIQMYCAVPRDQNMFSSLNFPDDYLKNNIYFNDGIYLIDLSKNQSRPLFESNSPAIDAVNISLFGNQLLFLNRYDQKLYGLGL